MAPLVRELLEFHVPRQYGPISVPLHVHPFCQMDLILDGRMILRTPLEQVLLRRGDGLLIPPLCRHGFEITGQVVHANIKLQIHPQYTTMLGTAHRVVRIPGNLLSLARQIRTDAHPLAAHEAAALATICLVRLLNAPQTAPAPPPPGESAELFDLIGQVIAQPHAGWTVRQLAQRCHLSEGHFTKLFTRTFGQTPRRFLLEARIWSAADRLNQQNQSIKSIAHECGYATVHSFTRAFKRAMGVAPAAYVKSQGRW